MKHYGAATRRHGLQLEATEDVQKTLGSYRSGAWSLVETTAVINCGIRDGEIAAIQMSGL